MYFILAPAGYYPPVIFLVFDFGLNTSFNEWPRDCPIVVARFF